MKQDLRRMSVKRPFKTSRPTLQQLLC